MDLKEIIARKGIQWLDVTLLVVGSLYQRNLIRGKLLELKKSIKELGFLPAFPITITPEKRIVDGQHRFVAAKELGLKKIPCVIVDFTGSLELEAAYFAYVNDYPSSKPRPNDYWHARYCAKEPIADYVYKLNEDPTSYLKDKVAIRGHASTSARFLVTDVLLFLNMAARNTADTWSRKQDQKLTEACLRVGYEEIRARVNVFLSFFFKWVGKDKERNPIPYKAKVLPSIGAFYMRLLKQNFLNGDNSNVIKKMSTFPFTGDFLKLDRGAKVQMLTFHYNAGKTKNRLQDTK